MLASPVMAELAAGRVLLLLASRKEAAAQ